MPPLSPWGEGTDWRHNSGTAWTLQRGANSLPGQCPPSKDGALGRAWHSPQAWHCPGTTPEPGAPRKTRDNPLGSGTAQQRGFSTESSKTLAQRGAAAPSLEAFSVSDVPRSRPAQGKVGVLATKAGAAAWLAPALDGAELSGAPYTPQGPGTALGTACPSSLSAAVRTSRCLNSAPPAFQHTNNSWCLFESSAPSPAPAQLSPSLQEKEGTWTSVPPSAASCCATGLP